MMYDHELEVLVLVYIDWRKGVCVKWKGSKLIYNCWKGSKLIYNCCKISTGTYIVCCVNFLALSPDRMTLWWRPV